MKKKLLLILLILITNKMYLNNEISYYSDTSNSAYLIKEKDVLINKIKELKNEIMKEKQNQEQIINNKNCCIEKYNENLKQLDDSIIKTEIELLNKAYEKEHKTLEERKIISENEIASLANKEAILLQELSEKETKLQTLRNKINSLDIVSEQNLIMHSNPTPIHS